MSIRITFHGAARMVTGSKHLLEVNGLRVLIDCGMFQGEGKESDAKNRHFGFDPMAVDAVVLSHAHIDHSGLLPRLVKEGFSGPIFATPATRDLCAIMLEDSAGIQESDHEREVRHARDGQRVPPPLYTVKDVWPAMQQFVTVPYGEEREVVPGVRLTFTDAGHILGSAVVNLVVNDGTQERRILFSGDVGRYVDRLLPEPAPPPQADIVICESTYGDRDHASIAEAVSELKRHVEHTCVEKKGKLIIPAFSVGKTQEVLYTLNELSNAGELPRIPVFVDSPLAIDATKVVRDHTELFRKEVREKLQEDPDLFSFRGVEFVQNSERSKQLNGRQQPCIIISASGMAEAGRILHHLKNNVEDGRNTVLITGFQAPNTLGRRIVEGRKRIKIFGEDYDVRARVTSLTGMSGHADRSELVAWAGHFEPPPRRTFLVHGEPDAAFALAERLRTQLGFPQVDVPELGQRFTL